MKKNKEEEEAEAKKRVVTAVRSRLEQQLERLISKNSRLAII